MSLILTLKVKIKIPVDMSPVIPENITGKKLSEISRMKLEVGNRKLALDDLFTIKGSSDSEAITIRKCDTKLDFIGHNMNKGEIIVDGSAGDYLGKSMTGGEIIVSGSTGRWAGTGMKSARIEIKKDAGDYLGATLPGGQYGMQGGLIHIHGNAGARVGEYMRRGIIAIEGDTGGYCGYRMRAGTILILGQSYKNIGLGMKRGSIILLKKPAAVPKTFNSCGTHELGFVSILIRELSGLGRAFYRLQKSATTMERIVGDMAVAGKGELLILNQS